MNRTAQRFGLGLVAVAALALGPEATKTASGQVAPACPDRDADGVTDAACGGSDCDDNDPNRYAGNIERGTPVVYASAAPGSRPALPSYKTLLSVYQKRKAGQVLAPVLAPKTPTPLTR